MGLAGHKNASYALLAQPSLVTLHFVLESAFCNLAFPYAPLPHRRESPNMRAFVIGLAPVFTWFLAHHVPGFFVLLCVPTRLLNHRAGASPPHMQLQVIAGAIIAWLDESRAASAPCKQAASTSLSGLLPEHWCTHTCIANARTAAQGRCFRTHGAEATQGKQAPQHFRGCAGGTDPARTSDQAGAPSKASRAGCLHPLPEGG